MFSGKVEFFIYVIKALVSIGISPRIGLFCGLERIVIRTDNRGMLASVVTCGKNVVHGIAVAVWEVLVLQSFWM